METIYTMKKTYVNNYRKIIYHVISLCIAIGLSSRKIPWATDDWNYLNYVIYSDLLLSNTLIKSLENPLFILVNEPVWLLINKYLSFLFEPEMVLRIIIFVSAFSVLYSLGRITNYSFLMIFFFLFLVQIVKNHVLHVRQGFALGIFLLGFTIKGKWGLILRLIAPFIHTGFWIVLFLEIFEKTTKKFFTLNARLSIFIIATFIFSFSLMPLMELSGDRRTDLYANNVSGSFYGLMLWILIGILLFLLVDKSEIGIIARYAMLFYIITYIFIDFGARVFENFIPLIVASALLSKKETTFIFVLLFLLYGGLNWYTWGGLTF